MSEKTDGPGKLFKYFKVTLTNDWFGGYLNEMDQRYCEHVDEMLKGSPSMPGSAGMFSHLELSQMQSNFKNPKKETMSKEESVMQSLQPWCMEEAKRLYLQSAKDETGRKISMFPEKWDYTEIAKIAKIISDAIAKATIEKNKQVNFDHDVEKLSVNSKLAEKMKESIKELKEGKGTKIKDAKNIWPDITEAKKEDGKYPPKLPPVDLHREVYDRRLIPSGRRVGNTTRTIDLTIQFLFEGRSVRLYDHSECESGFDNFRGRLFDRLWIEHKLKPDRGLTFDRKENILSLEQ